MDLRARSTDRALVAGGLGDVANGVVALVLHSRNAYAGGLLGFRAVCKVLVRAGRSANYKMVYPGTV